MGTSTQRTRAPNTRPKTLHGPCPYHRAQKLHNPDGGHVPREATFGSGSLPAQTRRPPRSCPFPAATPSLLRRGGGWGEAARSSQPSPSSLCAPCGVLGLLRFRFQRGTLSRPCRSVPWSVRTQQYDGHSTPNPQMPLLPAPRCGSLTGITSAALQALPSKSRIRSTRLRTPYPRAAECAASPHLLRSTRPPYGPRSP